MPFRFWLPASNDVLIVMKRKMGGGGGKVGGVEECRGVGICV